MIGRYVFVLAMGLLSLIISLIAQPLVLNVLGETVGIFDIVTAAIAGVFLFALYTVFQIPGYYKYGSIKGRVFMYIPVAGFLVTLLLLSKMPFPAGLVDIHIIAIIINTVASTLRLC